MAELELRQYARSIIVHIPWTHWVVMGTVSLTLTVLLLIRKKYSVYSAIALGLAVFFSLFLLDTAVVIRYFGYLRHSTGHSIGFDFDRLFHGNKFNRREVISNVVVFIPFGFFLVAFLGGTKRFGAWQLIGCAALASFGLSLCIESLQLVLHVGYFEVRDLVLNTAGGVVGAVLARGVDGLVKRVRRP